MINAEIKLINDKKTMQITIDLTKSFGVSKSGKSEIVATTSGNIPVGETGIKLGLNCYKPVSQV